MMKKYRIMYLLAVLSVLLCGLWGGARLAPALLAVLIALPVLSGIRLYLSAGGLSLSLEGEHSCCCGQRMEIKLKIEYKFWPAAGNVKIDVTEENHVFGTKKKEVYLLKLGRGRHHEFDIVLDTAVCGGRVIRISGLECSGLLGLFSVHKPLGADFAYTVYPYEARMYVSLNRHREREQPGDIYDGKKSGTDVSEVFGLREYREGDPLQGIHWKLSGKMQQLIVREFGRPVNYHTLLLLSPAFQYGSKRVPEAVASAVFDLGISLSRALLNQNIAHFVGYLSGSEICCLPVDSSHSYDNMLLHLMNHPVQRDGDKTLLAFISQQMHRQYTKVVYVAGEVNEVAAQNLSVLADLTVIEATKGASGYLAGDRGYAVIGISIENMRSIEHMISI
ncbi:MAG: DUF58 domain-containing protein [Lachnospiraceae bacterium]|nr:DUF58 domain-containing protein [Lachnospiraceae bacterium]